MYESFRSIQVVLNGSLELNRAPDGNPKDTLTSDSGATEPDGLYE